MSWTIHCRRCGALFVPDRAAILVRLWRLCPRCRGPLPPSGVPVIDGTFIRPTSSEAVA
jgi:hypothetical protein